jgi:hypothetical protein
MAVQPIQGAASLQSGRGLPMQEGMGRGGRGGWRTRAAVATAGAALVLVLAAGASAAASLSVVAPPQTPPRGEVYFGVTDTGHAWGFRTFANAVGMHPAVVETFHPWGNSLNQAMPRWRKLRAQPVLHISAQDPGTGRELITPKQIAKGLGDNYLLRLNRRFAEAGVPAFVRPLGEPNRCLNAWTAVACDGSDRGGGHGAVWYRRAFRRIYVLLHGGGTLDAINGRLHRLGLPRVRRRGGPEPNELPAAPVRVIWSTLPAGSPATRGNLPVNYFPGRRFVDWSGSDIYSRYTDFHSLNRFYRHFARNRPFAITEFGVWGADDPGFVRHLLRWVRAHPQTRMLVYYQDFGRPNPFRIQAHPRSEAVLRRALRSNRFPEFAPDAPEPLTP